MAREPRTHEGEPVIRAGHGQDLADALAARFLRSADAGDPEANDRLVAELGAWQRRRRSAGAP